MAIYFLHTLHGQGEITMTLHERHRWAEGRVLHRERQLAGKLASMACIDRPMDEQAMEIVINRLIDNAGIAMAAIHCSSVGNARAQAIAHPPALHPRSHGANILGLQPDRRSSAEWAAYANTHAVSNLDLGDLFLGAETVYPATAIPSVVAVAQQCGRSGVDLVRGIVTAYEIHIALARSLNLAGSGIHHVAHLGPAVAGGVGACLGLGKDVIEQSIKQSLSASMLWWEPGSTSSSCWAAAHVGKLAIEAVDRCMRGEISLVPAYEGPRGLLARLGETRGPRLPIEHPEQESGKRAMQASVARMHAADWQAQGFIDLAFELRAQLNVKQEECIDEIVLYTTDTGIEQHPNSGLGRKVRPDAHAIGEPLQHSLEHIFVVAFQDGAWHHRKPLTRDRALRSDTVNLQRRVRLVRQARMGGAGSNVPVARAEVRLQDGRSFARELACVHADSHQGRSYDRADFIRKFEALVEGVVSRSEQERFLAAVQRLPQLPARTLSSLNLSADLIDVPCCAPDGRGVF